MQIAGSTMNLQGVKALADAVHREPIANARFQDTDICHWAIGKQRYSHAEVPDLLIGLLTAGDVRWVAKNRVGQGHFRNGRLAVIPAYTSIDMQPISPLQATTVHISPDFANRVFEIGNGAALLEQADLNFGFVSPLIAANLVALAKEIQSPSQNGSIFADSVTTTLLHQVLFSKQSKAASPRRGGLTPAMLRKVRDYVNSELANPVRLDDLADLVGLSPFYFCRAFKAETGLTPHQFLTGARLRRARELLGDPGHSLSEIALAVGFSSHGHFSAAFRRSLGVSPSSFRRSI